jgi:hypothetical protein
MTRAKKITGFAVCFFLLFSCFAPVSLQATPADDFSDDPITPLSLATPE